ncbi:Purine nucleoside phosphorylase deoD-type [Chlamydia trachomatis]|nr:Purine nucleoside phosphorylase deoD-type [Chlamydia trachomatis]
MATPHISAEVGQIAPNVIFPGDPARAQRIAQMLMPDAELVSEVRRNPVYTGTVNGTPLSVMASGMGVPSLMIYATELYRFYGVQRIIRVGTCGAWGDTLNVGDVVVGQSAVTDSKVAELLIPGLTVSLAASPELLRSALDYRARMEEQSTGYQISIEPVFSTDYFYFGSDEQRARLADIGVHSVEMETSGLYATAMREGGQAMTVLTVSDHFEKESSNMSAEQRETLFIHSLDLAVTALTGSGIN